MFKQPNVECYLKSVVLDTEDDKRICKLRLFVTPITFDLASEVSPLIADRLFRKSGDGFVPVQEMDGPKFLIQVSEQSMEYRRHPEYVGHQVSVSHVSIGNLTAQKVIPGDPNFSLIFTASFEILDKTVITDLADLLHEKLFVTFAPMQPGLFDNEGGPVMKLECLLCQAAAPEFASSDEKRAYCRDCKHNAAEDDHPLKRIRPDVAAASAIADSMQEGDDQPKQKDPLAEEGSFINNRNRTGRKKRTQ